MKKSILCLAFIAACAAFGPAASAAEPAAPAAPPAPSKAPAVNAVPVSHTYMDSLFRAERAQRPAMPGPRGPQRIRGDAPERKAPPAFRHRRGPAMPPVSENRKEPQPVRTEAPVPPQENAVRESAPGPRGPQRVRGDAPERKAPPAFRHRRDGRWDGPRHHRDDCPYYDEEYDENGYCIAHHGRHHRGW